MDERPELWLHEEVLLLALSDDRGTPHAAQFRFAMGGAVLAELLLTDRLALEEGRRRSGKRHRKPDYRVAVKDRRPLSDPILDECALRVQESKKPRSPQDWVSRFSQLKDFKRRVAVGLCRRGILREREDRVLVLFRRTAYPTLDGAPERRIVERLRNAVLGDSERLDSRTAALVALADGTGLLKPVLGKDVCRQRKERIEAISTGDIVGEATKAAVQAAQAAAIAATSAATAAAVTVSS